MPDLLFCHLRHPACSFAWKKNTYSLLASVIITLHWCSSACCKLRTLQLKNGFICIQWYCSTQYICTCLWVPWLNSFQQCKHRYVLVKSSIWDEYFGSLLDSQDFECALFSQWKHDLKHSYENKPMNKSLIRNMNCCAWRTHEGKNTLAKLHL